MTRLAAEGAGSSAAESGSLSKLRARERSSHKLGDAVTVGVWRVDLGSVGSEHAAELPAPAHESFMASMHFST
jgi:hypothetical protein